MGVEDTVVSEIITRNLWLAEARDHEDGKMFYSVAGPYVGVSTSRRAKEGFFYVAVLDEELELGEEAFFTFEEAVQKVRKNMEEEAKVTLIWTVNEEENINGEKHLCILGPLRGRLANNCEGVKSGMVVEVNNGDEYVIGEDAFLTIQDVAAHITDKATRHEKK